MEKNGENFEKFAKFSQKIFREKEQNSEKECDEEIEYGRRDAEKIGKF